MSPQTALILLRFHSYIGQFGGEFLFLKTSLVLRSIVYSLYLPSASVLEISKEKELAERINMRLTNQRKDKERIAEMKGRLGEEKCVPLEQFQ